MRNHPNLGSATNEERLKSMKTTLWSAFSRLQSNHSKRSMSVEKRAIAIQYMKFYLGLSGYWWHFISLTNYFWDRFQALYLPMYWLVFIVAGLSVAAAKPFSIFPRFTGGPCQKWRVCCDGDISGEGDSISGCKLSMFLSNVLIGLRPSTLFSVHHHIAISWGALIGNN